MYFSGSRWQISTKSPKGSASEVPNAPRPRPTYVKNDDTDKALRP